MQYVVLKLLCNIVNTLSSTDEGVPVSFITFMLYIKSENCLDMIYLPVGEVYDALSCHKEDIFVSSPCEGSSMCVYHISYLLTRELGQYGGNITGICRHEVLDCFLYIGWKTSGHHGNRILWKIKSVLLNI